MPTRLTASDVSRAAEDLWLRHGFDDHPEVGHRVLSQFAWDAERLRWELRRIEPNRTSRRCDSVEARTTTVVVGGLGLPCHRSAWLVEAEASVIAEVLIEHLGRHRVSPAQLFDEAEGPWTEPFSPWSLTDDPWGRGKCWQTAIQESRAELHELGGDAFLDELGAMVWTIHSDISAAATTLADLGGALFEDRQRWEDVHRVVARNPVSGIGLGLPRNFASAARNAVRNHDPCQARVMFRLFQPFVALLSEGLRAGGWEPDKAPPPDQWEAVSETNEWPERSFLEARAMRVRQQLDSGWFIDAPDPGRLERLLERYQRLVARSDPECQAQSPE